MKRPLLLASLTLLGVAVATAVVATSRPDRKTTPKPIAKVVKSADHVDTLVTQIRRRFADRENVEFGFERLRRPIVRTHGGPIASKNDLVYGHWVDAGSEDGGDVIYKFDPRRARRAKNGQIQIRTEAGTWIDYEEDAKDQLFPENAAERKAVEGLRRAKREIAIYTFGLFDADKEPNRANGPAYLRQLGPTAPESKDLLPVARAAWRGEKPTLKGYKLRLETIRAERSCVSCHNSETANWTPDAPKIKAGDRLGLLVIAEKR